jgi:membrane protease YdiL (CAAX protease family)
MTEPVPYHRLLRTLPGYRWWKPLVAILLAFVFLVVGSVVVIVVGLVTGIATGEIPTDSLEHLLSGIANLAVLDAASPLRLFVSLASVAILLPCVQLALLCVGLRPISVRHSVAFRVRWRWMLFSVLPALAIIALSFGVSYGVFPLIDGEWLGAPTTDIALYAICAIFIVLLTPLQAAAEEYVFRGLLAQAIGAWIRYVPFAIIIPTILFASLHMYDIWGLLDVFVFGIAASLVVWRTGGLEAGIAMHSVNNVAIFLLLASGSLGTTVNEVTAGSPVSLGISIVTMALWVLWMSWLARRRGLARVGAWTPDPAANVLDQVRDAKEPAG